MSKKLPFYSYVGTQPSMVSFSKIMTINKSTFLDDSFMSKSRWDDIARQSWITNVVRGLAVTPLVIAKIDSCLAAAVEGTPTYDYFLELKTKNYEYVTCDGWNRNNTAFMFGSDGVKISHGIYEINDKGYQITIPKDSFWSELTEEQRTLIGGLSLPVTYVTKATRRDLADVFKAVNSSVAQNAMELRQALQTDIAEPIRNLAKLLDPTFKSLGLFSAQDINRRKTDEFILDCCIFVHKEFSENWTGANRDKYYNVEESVLTASFKYTAEILKRIIKVEKDFHDIRSAFLTFCLRVLLDKQGQKPKNPKKFDTFIQEKHIEFLNNSDLRLREYEDDGTTLKKEFTYKSASRRTPNQIKWACELLLIELSKRDDLVVSLDAVRAFSHPEKFQMWLLQGGIVGERKAICPATQKEIPLNEIFDGSKWHGDHIIPYDKGGKTIVSEDPFINNGQLICAVANRKKSNKMMEDVIIPLEETESV